MHIERHHKSSEKIAESIKPQKRYGTLFLCNQNVQIRPCTQHVAASTNNKPHKIGLDVYF